MKLFINQKIGYTVGVYGCSGEQFQLIVIDTSYETPAECVIYNGLYGHEHRISEAMKKKGFTQLYIGLGNMYGKLKKQDVKPAMNETEVLEYISKM